MPRTSTELAAAGLLWAALAALRLTLPAPASHDDSVVAPAPLLAIGVPERQATWAWWQVGRTWAVGADVAPAALESAVRGIGELDPSWRIPWIYGGLMLQALDAPEAEPLLEEGAARWPEDPWFPAALGVHLQDQGRVDEARRWLRAARERS